MTDTQLAIAVHAVNVPSETFIRNHLRGIAPHSMVLICEDGRGAEDYHCPTLSNITTRPPPRQGLGRLVTSVQTRWQALFGFGLGRVDRLRVRAFLEDYQPRALLAEYGVMGCVLGELCNELDLPLYVHFHGYDASVTLRNSNWVRRYRALFERATGLIVPSRFLAERLADVGCSWEKLHISPYGVDCVKFVPGAGHAQRFIAIGRLVEKKGPQLTIKAFQRIARRSPQARLDIVGDGPLWDECNTLIEELGLAGRVHMHGVQDPNAVTRLLQTSSIFLQHSVTARDGDTEGLPVAILEAMASGLPVIATQHSGIPEAVVDGVTGILVREHDIDAMADAMSALLDNPTKASAMGRAGRERVLAHFTLDRARVRLREIMDLPSTSTVDATAAVS